MVSALRKAILDRGVPERQTKAVDMPEWGCVVYARQFIAADTEAVAKLSERKDLNRGQVTAQVIIRGCVDEKGEPIFTREDMGFLADHPVSVTGRILAALAELNGPDLIPEEVEAIFADDPSGNSNSVSP